MLDFVVAYSALLRDVAKMWIRRLQFLWSLPNTAFGVLFVPLALSTGGGVRRIDDVLEVYGGAVSWLLRRAVPLPTGATALTLGHVILGRSAASLSRCRAHERVHVRQYDRWGPLFIPAYLLASVAAGLRGRDPYRDNPFEREAFGDVYPR